MRNQLIDLKISNPKRKDSNGLKNTIKVWEESRERFNEAIKATGNALSYVVAEGIKRGLDQASPQEQYFLGAASKWSPSISQMRSNAGGGASVSGWGVKTSYTQTPEGGVYITTFSKRDIVLARCASMGGSRLTAEKYMENVGRSGFGSRVLAGIKESISEHEGLIYQFLQPQEVMGNQRSKYSESLAKLMAGQIEGNI